MADWEEEVEKLTQMLTDERLLSGNLKEEREKLKRENEELRNRVHEMEGRMAEAIKSCEERMEVKMGQMVKDLMGTEGAVKKTSTPEFKLPKNIFGTGGSMNEGQKKKKKSSKKRMHERKLKARMTKSMDSLYSSVSGDDVEDEDVTDDSEIDVDIMRSMVIREIPRIERYDVYGQKDVVEFFREYESYCKKKFGEDDKAWLKELGEFLSGRLAEFYRIVMDGEEQDYDVVKERVIQYVMRVKDGVKYKKKNAFEEAKMKDGESLEAYAHRLETLARKKYGSKSINENKDLMKKFLATVPGRVREVVNARRKEKMRWKSERLMWEDVLEMIEDMDFDEYDRSMDKSKDVYMGRTNERSYREVLTSNPIDVMVKYLEDACGRDVYFGDNRNDSRDRSRYARSENGRRDRSQSGRRDRSQDRRRDRSESQRRNGRNNGSERKCYRCGKTGHMMSECRWANGACFGCGQEGHLVRDCPDPKVIKCFSCGGSGHRVSECNKKSGRAVENVCGNCGVRGHYARMCRKARSECEKCGLLGHVASVCRRVNSIEERRNVNGANQGN